MASTGAPLSSACERIGARLFASRPNHRRESYVVRGVPRNSVAPTAVLPPSVAPPSRTSDLSARALQVVSIVCRSIGNYLRRAAEVGEGGARALRRGVSCLLPRSVETGRAGPRLRAPRACMWRGSRGAHEDDKDEPIDFSTDAWRSPMYRDPLEALEPTRRLGIRSVESRHHTEVTFRNATKGKARLFWLNYWGEEIRYKTLAPGQMHTQQTFETHPWTFATVSDDEDDEGVTRRRRLVTDGGAAVFWPTRSEEEIAADDDVDGGRVALRRRRERLRLEGVPPDPGRVCAIREPSPTPWTREAHATKFPLFFRLACRELVLSHARLRDADRTAPAAGPERRRVPSGDEDVRDAKRLCVGRGGSSAAVELGPAGGPEDEDEDVDDAEPATTLGDLPADVVAYIIELAAPIVPAYADVRISSATPEGTASRGPGPVFG